MTVMIVITMIKETDKQNKNQTRHQADSRMYLAWQAFCGKEKGRIKGGTREEGSLYVSHALLVLTRPNSHRPFLSFRKLKLCGM